MSDQSYKPVVAPAPPAPQTQAPPTSSSRGRGASARSDRSTTPAAEAAPTEGPGFFDRLGALSGDTHLRTLLGPSGAGVEWDNTEKGANKPNVDKWGNDRIRLAKLRIASVSKAGVQARNLHADGLDLNERTKARDGRFVADLDVASASADSIVSATPAMKAAGLELAGIKVHREFVGDELTHFFSKPGDTRVEVQTASVTGLDSENLKADRLSATGMAATTDGTTHQLSGASMSGQGLSAGGVSIERAEAGKSSASIGPTDVRFATESLGASGVSAGDARFATIGTHGLSLQSGPGGVSVAADRANATGFAAPGVTIADAQADALKVGSRDGTTTVATDRLALGATDARGFHAAGTVLSGASASTDGRATQIAARQVNSSGLVAGGATIGNVSASDASLRVGDGVTGRFGSAEMKDLKGGGMSLAGAHAQGLGLDVNDAGVAVSADRLAAQGLSGHGVSVASADATGARLGTAGGLHLGLDQLHAKDVAGAGASASSVDASAIATRLTPTGVNGSIGAMEAKGLRAGDVSATRASLTNATLDNTGATTAIGAGHIEADGFSAGALNAAKLSAEQAKLEVGADGTTGSAASVQASRLRGGGVSADGAEASGLSFQNGGGNTTARAKSASATKLAVGDASAASVRGTGVALSSGSQGTSASADTLNASRLRGGGASLESAEAKRLAVSQTGTGAAATTTARADSLTGAGLVAGDLTAKRIGATGVSASLGTSRGQPTVNASARTATAGTVAYNGDAGRTTAESFQADGLAHRQTGGKSTTTATGTSATGVHHRTAPASGNGGGQAAGSGPSLVQQAAGLVDRADVKASVPLNPMTTGEGTKRITVKPETTAYVEVQVRGGRIVPAETKAQFSKPLDTWGWTTVPGVYMSGEGKLYAEVSGLWDSELTEQMNKALGRSGSTVPLRVSELAAAASGGGAGGGSTSSGPSMARTDEIKASGTVGLRAGTLRSEGMSATLGSAPGANTAKVEVDGSRSLSVQFSRLLLEAFGIKAGGAAVDVRSVSAGNASMRQAGGRTDVHADSLRTGAASITR